jgi:hypothetical protein
LENVSQHSPTDFCGCNISNEEKSRKTEDGEVIIECILE